MPRVPTNYVIAAAIALAVIVWMATGWFSDDSGASSPTAAEARGEPFEVQVERIEAEPVTRRLVVQGQVVPERSALLRAQTTGQVESVSARPGQAVKAGDILLQLAMDDRRARLREAEALLRQREAEFEAAQRLGESGFQARLRQDEAATALESARAAVESIRTEIRNTRITAPFDGVVDRRHVDVGDYAGREQPLVSVVDNDPLTAVANLSQRHFDAVQTGLEAQVTLVSGDTRRGRLTAIAPRADEASRTFRVEVEVANPDRVPANTSAEIRIPIGRVEAHRLSPAALALDEEGRLGVKTVNAANQVAFVPVEIVRSDAQGVWVTGLPAQTRIITVGGGFVVPGETVRAVEVDTGPAAEAG